MLRLNTRVMGIVAALAVFAFAGMSVAVAANCASGHQDAGLLVTICTNSTTYVNGQTAHLTGIIKNRTRKTQSVNVTVSITGPLSTSFNTVVSVAAGSTFTTSSSLKISALFPRGTYNVAGQGSIPSGTSSAAVNVTLQ